MGLRNPAAREKKLREQAVRERREAKHAARRERRQAQKGGQTPANPSPAAGR
jgi:hypothetical protein